MEVSEKIFEYIDALAQKLGVASEYVFAMLVRQQIIEGIAYLSILLLISFVIGIATSKIVKHTISNWDHLCNKDREIGWSVASAIAGFVALILLTADVKYMPLYTMKIFNPEYYAIKEIMDVFKK